MNYQSEHELLNENLTAGVVRGSQDLAKFLAARLVQLNALSKIAYSKCIVGNQGRRASHEHDHN